MRAGELSRLLLIKCFVSFSPFLVASRVVWLCIVYVEALSLLSGLLQLVPQHHFLPIVGQDAVLMLWD